MHKKMERILAANNIDARHAKILNVDADKIIVEYQNKKYQIIGTTKTEIIEEKISQNIEVPNEEDLKEIKKPRGWHFRPVFVDSEGNVYHKGVLQPELKGTMDPTP